jgi:hypothetical protein
MSDPSPGAVESALTSADLPGSAPEPLPERDGGGCALVPGRRWRNFQVKEAMGSGFLATDATTMEDVVLHARPLDGAVPIRRDTWQRLCELQSDGIVPPVEAHEENGWRYEVSALPRGVPLREWIAAHQMGLVEIETLVRQLAAQLEALHEHGIVHLRVQPGAIFIEDEGGGWHVRIGGFEAATLHGQTDLVPIAVNPYYAPPEAAGLFKHKPGPDLCAWDWWGVGRVVQEIVHGRHVYGLLFERDVTNEPPELRARVEAALLDRDPSGVRAGAVELLPETVSPRLRLLLRGLLAGSRDGRWHGDQVLHWAQGENVPDRYDLPRDARLFRWGRRAFTVGEAAEVFLQPDFAFDGLLQFFPSGPDELTMRAFLGSHPAFRPEHERVEEILGYVDTFAWQQLPLNARRAAIAGLAWRSLAPASFSAPLSVQRWRLDPAGMQEMLADASPPEALAFARVLTAGAYRRAVEAIDAPAGRTLALLAGPGMEALQAALARTWIATADEHSQAHLLWFALESDKDLLARRDRLRAAYATASEPALAELLAKEKPSRTELMLLGFVGERAPDFGFITHAEWSARRAAELSDAARRIRIAIFWRRAARMIAAAPGLLGRWPTFLVVWAAPIALAAAGRAWFVVGGLMALALAFRWVARAGVNALLARHVPDAPPWTWRDGPARAARAATESWAALEAAERAAPLPAFLATVDEIRKLRLKNVAIPEVPPRLVAFWIAGFLTSVIPVGFCVLPWIGVDFAPRTPSPVLVRPAVVSPVEGEGTAPDGAIYEIYNDGFGRRRRGPLRAWDVASSPPRPFTVVRMTPASAQQRAYARVGAELLLEPYPRKDLKVTLAVPVPAKGEWAVVLYDTDGRELADRRTFFLPGAPTEKSWYWLGNRRVVYLGLPPRLPELQKTLAQP